MKIAKLYNRIKSIGLLNADSGLERKRIILLNIFLSNWLLIEFALIIEDSISKADPSMQILVHTGTVIGLVCGLILQYRRKFIAARVLFFSLIFYSNFMFCNFFEKGGFIEYFYIVIPVFLLLFTNNKKLLIAVFVLSYLLFVIPIHIFPLYPEGTFGSPLLILVQFVILFLLVEYFKSANEKNEKALDEQRTQLTELNAFQSQFFINVSHEIRTPLTLIKGATTELDFFENTMYVNEAKAIKSQLNQQSNKIITIVNDVLDLAKMKNTDFKLTPKPTQLNSLLHSLYLAFEPLCKQKNISFIYPTSQNEHWVMADHKYLKRCINNILVNAIKYTPKNGTIEINTTENEYFINTTIKDSGIGVQPEDVDKIFNQFYQVKNDINRSGGSGVGLAFCKEIVELHNGTISIDSKPNKGSIFTISIPKSNAEKEAVKPAIENLQNNPSKPQKESTNITSNKRLLIVDDNYDMRQYLLKVCGNYNCLEAENGVEAIEILKTEKIDMLLTDYMMPKMDGLALLKNIKEMQINCPVLMLTARNDAKSKMEVLRLGIDDYMNKPFEEEELLVRINNALNNHTKKISFIQENKISTLELSENKKFLKEIEDYVLKNVSNSQLTQDDIAAHLRISKSTLVRRVKSETGLTPNQFITEIKLQKARKLMEQNPDLLLKTLAFEVGYMHLSHFSKLFKKRFGVHPGTIYAA